MMYGLRIKQRASSERELDVAYVREKDTVMATKRKDLQTAEWRTTIRQAILERDGYQCDMCKHEVEGPDATVDHIVPAAMTGEPVNNMSNLRLLCRSCNSKKGTKLSLRKGFIKPGWGITL